MGGSPAYSDLIAERVHQFAKTRNLPIYTFAESYATSGGYFLICIGDEVYAHETSYVGSIGVISQAAAFKKILDKNKIVLNQVSSSENLSETILDSLNSDEILPKKIERMKQIQSEIFATFKSHILKHRGTKFSDDDHEKLFNADVFLGEEAKSIGLIDNLGDITTVIKEKHEDCELLNFSKLSKW